MSKNSKNTPTYIIILAIFVGMNFKFAPQVFQLIGVAIVAIIMIYEIYKSMKSGGENNRIGIYISVIAFIILIGLAVYGDKYQSMSLKTQLILYAIAFIQFILSLATFGLRIVINNGNKKETKKYIICVCMLMVIILLFVLIILFHNK